MFRLQGPRSAITLPLELHCYKLTRHKPQEPCGGLGGFGLGSGIGPANLVGPMSDHINMFQDGRRVAGV